ncbi:MAG: UDP-N-acetylmuramoyl-tripeptide--D-alanyl-D-alanine ligase [Thermodesulfobacteriota bacterium]
MAHKETVLKNIDIITKACSGIILQTGSYEFSGDISIDSRKLDKGSLFIALKGENFDGHDFIETAAKAGAAAVIINKDKKELVEKFSELTAIAVDDTVKALGDLAGYKRKNLDLKVIGITGSAGKTTTREMLKSILKEKHSVLGPEKNYNNHIGVPLTLLKAQTDHDFAVIEMGMNSKGEIGYLSQIARPDIALITKIAPAHIESFSDIEEIAAEKASVCQGMEKGSFVIINDEDSILCKYLTDHKVLKFGYSESSDLIISEPDISEELSSAILTGGIEEKKQIFEIRLRVFGNTAIKNAAVATLAALTAKADTESVKAGLLKFSGIEGRFFKICNTNSGLNIIDDTYNSNPESLKASINDFNQIRNKNRCFIVIGDMLELGKDSAKYHRSAGETAAEINPEGIFIYGDFAKSTAEGAENKSNGRTYIFTGNHEEISQKLLSMASPGDWILIKGSRGSKMENVLKRLTEKPE